MTDSPETPPTLDAELSGGAPPYLDAGSPEVPPALDAGFWKWVAHVADGYDVGEEDEDETSP